MSTKGFFEGFEPYSWHKTLTYDADVTMVITARDRGKTFGLRLQCVKDFLKDGSPFVEICRNKNQVSTIMDGYFDKLALAKPKLFEGLVFKSYNKKIYAAKKPTEIKDKNEKQDKPDWKVICYFVALTDQQLLKRATFVNVKRMIFDEAILEQNDVYHDYLPGEYTKLANLVDTVARQQPGDKSKIRLYLLGNACDPFNPYFAVYKINAPTLEYGYHWYNNKSFLLHYEKPPEGWEARKRDSTVAGRMLSPIEDENSMMSANQFTQMAVEFVANKTPNSVFQFAIVYKGITYGIWCDYNEGYYYVHSKVPKDAKGQIFALTTADNQLNVIIAKRTNKALNMLAECFRFGIVRFETAALYKSFTELLTLFGLR